MNICALLLGLGLTAGLAHSHGRPASRVQLPPAPAGPAAALDTTAEKMLAFQRSNGGWPKAVNEVKVDYRHLMSAADLATARRGASQEDATIDNNATTREISYLISAFKTTQNPAYRQAAENGIRYLLKMQQPSGGFPQYYPDARFYRAQITYNDNAMIRALEVLKAVADKKGDFALVDPSLVTPAQKAVDKGVQCILKTQYVQHGKLTAWGAQHDRTTLLPCKARAFELASLSGDESVGITEFLLNLDQPSPEVRKAIAAAVAWFEASKIENTAVQDITDPSQPKGHDRVMVAQPGSTVWARFYDLDTNKPIYVGRDGVKHDRLADIEAERRTGYVYASTWPAKLLARDYPKWQQKWGSN
ncbi:pectate lyase [Hymenobacter ginsengisoli]|uniref:Pectate lyase n=1 Tax=Hymenobacter ginsengisoli TaxID=1051626 RepID=A0ABP8QQH1_9BACT|nr:MULTISPECIES: pectate lyase [unclassified Hymenobacter]MBO2033986.1 pectate lyase [Hymenobacter sp. BT559]